MLRLRCAALFIVIAIIASAPVVWAETDPPSRVARLSFLKGEVSFQPAGADDWADAALNRPLTSSDRLWTGETGRAEMSIDTAALRVGPGSSFSFLNLDDSTVQAQLTQGTLHVRLRRLDERQTFEVDTPNAAITLLRAGEYRIDVYGDSNATNITVRSGYAQVDGSGRAFSVRAHQLGRLYGDDAVDYTVTDAPEAADEFDAWCRERDARYDRAQSAKYVPREMIGYEDLDDYGYWTPVAEYGTVWMPRAVPVGWAPYRFGHWAWIEPWGWTWIDNTPWGFAPFHYGRWALLPGGWAWVPGPIMYRPVYAPALVAFIGGSHWGFAVGGVPLFGWFPLGPREVYFPAYRSSRRYFNHVNVTNIHVTNVYVTNIYNRYHDSDQRHFNYLNQHIPGAITTASQDVFTKGRPVHGPATQIPVKSLTGAEVTHIPPVAPDRKSLIGAARPTTQVPPPSVLDRKVRSRMTPPSGPQPFSQRQTALAADPGRPLPITRPTRSERAATTPLRPTAPVRTPEVGIPPKRGDDARMHAPERPTRPVPDSGVTRRTPPEISRPMPEHSPRPTAPNAGVRPTQPTARPEPPRRSAPAPEMSRPAGGSGVGRERPAARPATEPRREADARPQGRTPAAHEGRRN